MSRVERAEARDERAARQAAAEMQQAQAAIMFLMQATQKAAMEGGDNVQQ